MDRIALERLKATATEARNLAHEAYLIALKNRQAPGDTHTAYSALIQSNAVLRKIDQMLIEAIRVEIG